MAKCIGSVITCETEDIKPLGRLSNLTDDITAGEVELNKCMAQSFEQLLDIANDFAAIKHSATDRDDHWDGTHLQTVLSSKLKKLIVETTGVAREICELGKLMTVTKHRYFIHFTFGTIHNMKNLIKIVGRLSELSNDIYYKEQMKPLVSDQSITIHSLTCIWSTTIDIMISFDRLAREKIFNEHLIESDDYNFLMQLDFSTAGVEMARLFLMDLIVTSWIKFQRLVKYDDLVKSIPFLCPCHSKQFLATIDKALDGRNDGELLCDMLQVVIDHQCRPSLMTQSMKRMDIIPLRPYYLDSDPFGRAYFVVWHLYSLSKVASKESHNDMIKRSLYLLDDCLETINAQFSIACQQGLNHRLSPHQEERFKLVLEMFNYWCEYFKEDCLKLMIRMFTLFDEYWQYLGSNYFDNSSLRVNGLTVFQLFTKLVDEFTKYKTELMAQSDSKLKVPQIERDERKMTTIWDKLLARIEPVPCQPQAQQQSKSKVS